MRKAWSRYGAAAAAFVAGVALTGGVLLASYGGGQTYEVSTAIGQRARVLLPDGTAVWLNSSTRLAYKSGWLSSERKASLSGEAYFDVKRNELKPFVVECQGVRTKVLGTKFNVRARNYENRVVTTLLKGSVQMFCGEEEEDGHLLSPGQTLSVDLDTRNAVLITNDHPDEVLLWIKGEMRFSDRTLADITATLSRLYNVKFHLADGGLKEERFTCHFKTDTSLDEILHTLSLTKYFSYHIDGNEVYVEGVKR